VEDDRRFQINRSAKKKRRKSKGNHTFVAKANAYSATTVFPAEVWAATKTDSPFSR